MEEKEIQANQVVGSKGTAITGGFTPENPDNTADTE